MIIGTITVIMLLFNGGHAGIFTFDVFKQGVENSIAEKTRVKQIEKLIETADDEMETHTKRLDDASKKLLKLTRDYSTNLAELDQFLSRIDREHDAFQEQLIQVRMQIKKEVTKEEWASIYAVVRSEAK